MVTDESKILDDFEDEPKKEETREEKPAPEPEAKPKEKKEFGWWSYAFVLVIGLVIGYGIAGIGSPTDAMSVSKSDIGNKVIGYVTANYLSAQGMSAKLIDVSEDAGFYKISFDIMRGDSKLQPSTAYVTKDGKKLILGNVVDMTKPLPATGAATADVKKSDKPKVQLFVMSFCPYGEQAEDSLYPVIKLLGDKIEFEPHFIVSVSGDGKTVSSLHGLPEANEDMRQAWIWKNHPDKFWTYLNYINKNCNLNNIEACWTQGAKEAGLNSLKVKEGAEKEGIELMKAEQELASKFSVSGSPTLLINEVIYQGGRSPDNFKTGICASFNKAPDECGTELAGSEVAAEGACE